MPQSPRNKEETSLQIENIKPLQVTTRYDKENGIYYLFIGYKCKATSSQVKLSEEHSEYDWVTKEEFLALESADFLANLVQQLEE